VAGDHERYRVCGAGSRNGSSRTWIADAGGHFPAQLHFTLRNGLETIVSGPSWLETFLGVGAQAGIRSDLHLITGRVYSFLLTEISNEPSAEPDLKLLVEPKDKSSIGGVTALQGYVRASEAEAYKKELQALHAQTDGQIHAAEARMAGQVNKYKADYQKKLLFDYELDKKAPRELFLVSMIYYDDAVTYIMCAAPEKPALYEIKDGKPNLWPSSETSTTLSSSISSKNLGSGPSSARRSRSSSSAISASTVLFGAAVLSGP
jgi:hypothetical protein